MSCCGNGSYPTCNDASTNEVVSSWLSNLTTNIFGTVTKTTTSTGGTAWSGVCNPNAFGVTNYPINQGEGYMCYIMRILGILGWIYQGTYNGSLAYSVNSVVIYSNSLYIATQAVPAGTYPTNATYWSLILTAPPGPTGPAGPSSSPARGVYRTSVSYSASNSDDEIYCVPAAGLITITIPVYSSLLTGKAYYLVSNGSYNVNITLTGADKFQTNLGAVSTITLPAGQSSSVYINSTNDANWFIN